MAAICSIEDFNDIEQLIIPEMTVVCGHCQALQFPNESRTMCCHNGKVEVPLIHNLPDTIYDFVCK